MSHVQYLLSQNILYRGGLVILDWLDQWVSTIDCLWIWFSFLLMRSSNIDILLVMFCEKPLCRYYD